MPGKLMHNLRHLSRVCGGSSQAARQAMIALYRHIVEGDLDPTDCLTAELVKTAENAYRDVNIAFANELALICEAAGGDVWKVRELVNKSPGRNVLLPGAGVGGHCIPKDPWLLARPALEKGVPLRLIPAAREVNDSMPEHVVALVERGLEGIGQPVAGARVLVLGYAYRENTDDIRNSPTIDLVDLLARRGALVTVHDPFIDEYSWDLATGEGFDVAIGMVSHDIYRALAPADLRAKVVVDTRQIWPDIARPDKHGHRHIKLGGN